MYDFSNRIAVVTGAAKGIGAAVAERYIQDGALGVALLDMDLEGAEATAKRLDPSGKRTIAVQCDVSNEQNVQEAMAKVVEKFGKVDILVNNAGITRDSMFHKMTSEQFQKVMDVHVNGSFYCTRAVVEGMRDQGWGRIVNISSTSAFGNMGQANYSAAKSALIGLTNTLAIELAAKGVNVNAVAPGLINTDIIKTIPEKNMEMFLSKIPIRRGGEPSEVASLVAFLSSDDSSYVTGQTILCAGGMR